MEDGFWIFLAFILFCWLSWAIGNTMGRVEIKTEAFERGFMVECVGVTGYYWSCE